MKFIKDLFIKYKEIIMYLIFGVLTTLVSWGSYALLESSCGVTAANALSVAFAIIFAYVTNKLFVFESKSWAPSLAFPEFVKFVVSRLLTAVIEIAGVPLLVKIGLDQPIMGKKGMLAKIVVSVVIVILNYVFGKFLVFTKKNNADKNNNNSSDETNKK